jgi:hypothetical protein
MKLITFMILLVIATGYNFQKLSFDGNSHSEDYYLRYFLINMTKQQILIHRQNILIRGMNADSLNYYKQVFILLFKLVSHIFLIHFINVVCKLGTILEHFNSKFFQLFFHKIKYFIFIF